MNDNTLELAENKLLLLHIIKSIKYDNLEDDVQAKYNQKLSTILFGK